MAFPTASLWSCRSHRRCRNHRWVARRRSERRRGWVSLSANNRRHDGFQFDMRTRFCRRQLSPSHKKQQQMGSTRSQLVAKLICGRKVLTAWYRRRWRGNAGACRCGPAACSVTPIVWACRDVAERRRHLLLADSTAGRGEWRGCCLAACPKRLLRRSDLLRGDR